MRLSASSIARLKAGAYCALLACTLLSGRGAFAESMTEHIVSHVTASLATHAAIKAYDAHRENSDHGDTKVALATAGSGAPTPGLNSPLALPLGDGFAGCPQLFPGNAPMNPATVGSQWHVVALCSNHFAVLSSGLTKTPLFVVEKLNRVMLGEALGEERTDQFYPDPRLAKGSRAELIDFKGSGFDRGHMANAADQPDQQSMIQSFSLSNMVPQDPVNNRKGAWIKAEKDTRKYVKRAAGEVFVFSGPLFRPSAGAQQQTVGPDKVWVPTHLFKLVYDETTGKAWAHIMANTAEAQLEAPVSYAEFVRITGWQLLDAQRAARAAAQ